MSQSIRELIDDASASGNWDAVADWCETFDWSQAQEIPVAEYYLKCAADARASSEDQILEAVSAARASGMSWSQIGRTLAISGQAAQRHYSSLIDVVNPTNQEPADRQVDTT